MKDLIELIAKNKVNLGISPMNLEKRSSRALLIEDDIKKERVSTLNILKRKIKERILELEEFYENNIHDNRVSYLTEIVNYLKKTLLLDSKNIQKMEIINNSKKKSPQ